MAIITSAASGNFSDTATWVGGVVPTVGDTARVAAGHVVTIDVNTTCDAIESVNTTGYFILPNGVTLTANVQGGSMVGTFGTLTVPANATVTINGNVTLTVGGNNNICLYLDAANAIVNINGNVAQTASNAGTRTLDITGGAAGSKIYINGNVLGQPGGVGGTIFCSATNVEIEIIGNVEGANFGAIVSSTDTKITVTGDCVGGSGNLGRAVNLSSGASEIEVTGDVIGGTNLGAAAILTNGSVIVTGDVKANAGAGIESNGQASIDVIGSLVLDSSSARCAIVAASNTSCILDGPIQLNSNNSWPIAVLNYQLRDSNTTVEVNTANDGPVTYVNEDSVNGLPAEVDVRDGTVYGALGGLTGSLAVPDPQYVLPGVPTDDTVGTLDLVASIADVTGAQIAAAITS
jgi:hypothetical protein